MAAELRWILLGCSVVLLAGIWWWGARRARQMPDTSLRDGAGQAGGAGQAVGMGQAGGVAHAVRAPNDEAREWGVPPFEPLSIRTADFDQLQVMDIPMTATADPLDVTLNMEYAEREIAAGMPAAAHAGRGAIDGAGRATAAEVATAPAAATASELAMEAELAADAETAADVEPPAEARLREPAATPVPPRAAPPAEEQRIFTVRVSALDEARWDGAALLAALESHGLFHGRYKVFHRKDDAGRTLFCAASLVEPGTFDLTRMPDEQYRGLTLFAVLPGPADGMSTIDALIATADDLAESLRGQVQDSKGAPLSPQRVDALRADAAPFRSLVTMGG